MIITFGGPKPRKYFFKLFKNFEIKGAPGLALNLKQLAMLEKTSYARVWQLAKYYISEGSELKLIISRNHTYYLQKRT